MIVLLILGLIVFLLLSRWRRKARQRVAVAGLAETLTPNGSNIGRLSRPRFRGSRGSM